MLKHLEDKRVCPKCGHPLHEHGYLMARESKEIVLPLRLVGWIVTYAVVLTALSLHIG